MSKRSHTPASAAAGIQHAISVLDGRWKLLILFHLFGGKRLRFSEGRIPPHRLGTVPLPSARQAADLG